MVTLTPAGSAGYRRLEGHGTSTLVSLWFGTHMEVLVEEGLAKAYPYEPNTRYEGRFAAAQEQARAAGVGIWGLSLNQQCLLADPVL